MYFPKGFDAGLAIELGELIQQAYDQFEAFENEEDWKLNGNYSLTTVLSYIWSPERLIEKGIHNYDLTIKKISRNKRNESAETPIGFVAERQGRMYLILRGTQTAKEWIRNFSISLRPYLIADHGMVHEGFMQMYDEIRGAIIETLSSTSNHMKLYVGGHSLGAALATLALPDIESKTRCRVRALYTFGSPRVGDVTFVRAFNESYHDRSFRIANTSDLVTSLPLPVPLANIVGGYFSHVDVPVDMTVQKDDMETNHGMETYLSTLSENRQRKGFFGRALAGNVR
jgi:triacylglycerol lipase